MHGPATSKSTANAACGRVDAELEGKENRSREYESAAKWCGQRIWAGRWFALTESKPVDIFRVSL